MRRIFFSVLFMLVFCGHALADDLWPLGEAPWGSSREHVAKLFKLSSVPAKGDLLVLPPGEVTRNGVAYPLHVGLNFPGNKLSSLIMNVGMPGNKPMTPQGRQEIAAFLADTLTKEYGQPVRVNDTCDNNIKGCTVSEWKRGSDTTVQLISIANERQSVSIGYFNAAWLREQKSKRAR